MSVDYQALYEQVIGENEQLRETIFRLRNETQFHPHDLLEWFYDMSMTEKYLVIAAICIIATTVSTVIANFRGKHV